MSVLNSIPQTALEVFNRVTQDIKNELNNSNPWFRNALLRAQSLGYSNRIFDLYTTIRTAIKETTPYDATGERLQLWATLKDLTPGGDEYATGKIITTGVIDTVIDANTIYKQSEVEYKTLADAKIALISKDVTDISVAGTIMTVTTADPHEFGKGIIVTISGADQAAFNDEWEIYRVTAEDQFEAIVPLGTPAIATGVILALVRGTTIEVQSVEKGSVNNVDNDTAFVIDTPVAGLSNNAVSIWGGVTGGQDVQTQEEFRDDIIFAWQNPKGAFNPSLIEQTLKSLSGITRVWVHRVTPSIGRVTVYFVRDNDDSIIPDTAERARAKDALLEVANANLDPANLFVNEPLTAVPIDTTITNVIPNTVTMQEAVKETVRSFFRGDNEEGVDFDPDKLKGAVFNTYDVLASQRIESFTFNAAARIINQGEIATEGTTSVS